MQRVAQKIEAERVKRPQKSRGGGHFAKKKKAALVPEQKSPMSDRETSANLCMSPVQNNEVVPGDKTP